MLFTSYLLLAVGLTGCDRGRTAGQSDGADLALDGLSGSFTITNDDPQKYGLTFKLSGETTSGTMTVTGTSQYLEL